MTTQGFGRRGAARRPPMANRKRETAVASEAEASASTLGGATPLQLGLCFAGALVLALSVVAVVNMGTLSGGPQPAPSAARSAQVADPVEAPRKVAAAGPEERSAKSNERVEQAVSAFFSFYHVNARARVEHCAKHRVDIAAFADRFKSKHSGIYDQAIAAARRSGLTEDRLWNLSRLNLLSMVATDMAGAEDKLKSGPDGACKAMNEYAAQFVDNLDFKTIQPDAHRVLMGT